MIRSLVLSVLLLPALNCSGFILKTFYSNIDTLVINEIENSFAFEDPKQEFVNRRIAIHHGWHRYQELPRYSDFCENMAQKIEKGLNPKDVEYMEASIKKARQRLSYRILPDAIRVFQGFDEKQIEQQRRLFKQSNAELQEELAQPLNVRQKGRIEKTISFFEFFTGSLTSEQITLIHNSVRSMPDTLPPRLQYRKKMQEEFLEHLAADDPGKLESFLTILFTDTDATYTPEYRSVIFASRGMWKKLMLDMDATLTPQQRVNAAAALRDLSISFLELAGRSSSAAY